MKAIYIAVALLFSIASATAFACPKGTHPVGGTGAHHKGGKCVATDAKTDVKAAEAKPAEAATEAKTDGKAAMKKGKKKMEKKAEDAAK